VACSGITVEKQERWRWRSLGEVEVEKQEAGRISGM
jgi:hypothetical protein